MLGELIPYDDGDNIFFNSPVDTFRDDLSI